MKAYKSRSGVFGVADDHSGHGFLLSSLFHEKYATGIPIITVNSDMNVNISVNMNVNVNIFTFIFTVIRNSQRNI